MKANNKKIAVKNAASAKQAEYEKPKKQQVKWTKDDSKVGVAMLSGCGCSCW